MHTTWMSKLALMALMGLIVALGIAPSPARGQDVKAMAGWVWMSPDSPYAYSVDEGNWIFLSEPPPGTSMWFMNLSTSTWSSEGISNWVWYVWPYGYSIDAAAWIYTLVPAGGGWVYHYGSGTWEQLP